jgi:hypothetical protein
MGRRIQTATEDHWDEPPRRASAVRRGVYLGPIRITPVRVVLVVAAIGTLAYLAYALTVRDTSQIPMLASGAAVLGIVFLGLAVAGAHGTLVAGGERRNRDALALALGGGIAAMIGFGAIAGAVVLALVWTSG